MNAPPYSLQDLNNLLLASWCQTPHYRDHVVKDCFAAQVGPTSDHDVTPCFDSLSCRYDKLNLFKLYFCRRGRWWTNEAVLCFFSPVTSSDGDGLVTACSYVHHFLAFVKMPGPVCYPGQANTGFWAHSNWLSSPWMLARCGGCMWGTGREERRAAEHISSQLEKKTSGLSRQNDTAQWTGPIWEAAGRDFLKSGGPQNESKPWFRKSSSCSSFYLVHVFFLLPFYLFFFAFAPSQNSFLGKCASVMLIPSGLLEMC